MAIPVLIICSRPGRHVWMNFTTTTLQPGTAAMTVVQQLLLALPRNLHKDKQQQKLNQQQQQQQQNIPETLTNAAASVSKLDTLTEEEGNDNDEGLVVAWQYRKDVQQERLGLAASSASASSSSSATSTKLSSTGGPAGVHYYCHSYDLQGRLADQMDVLAATTIVPLTAFNRRNNNNNNNNEACGTTTRQCGFQYYRQLVAVLQSRLESHPRVVVRVLLYHPDVTVIAFALPLFLHYIRQHKLPVVVMVAIQPLLGSSNNTAATTAATCLQQLRRCADVVLSTESFVARRGHYPPAAEFRHWNGLLTVRRAATCTLASSVGHFADCTVFKRPAAALYGLARSARKLNVSLLHMPPMPDNGTASKKHDKTTGSSTAATTTTAPATSGCSSSGDNSPLDF
jgi:hypothetical protein